MTDQNPGIDQRKEHLAALRDELTRQGVRCALNDRGAWPRLRIYCPGEGGSAEFDNNVVAAPIAGRWFFFWPGAEPIGSVTRVAAAARRIIDDLCLDGDDGTGMPVASLAVQRMLQHARSGISSVHLPGVPPGGAAAHPQAAPYPARPALSLPRTGLPGTAPGPRGPVAAGEPGEDEAPCRVLPTAAPAPGGIAKIGRTPWRG